MDEPTTTTDKIRALARLSGAAPSAGALETEIRSQGAPNFKTEPSGTFAALLPTIASWEWNFGVPQTAIKAFIEWLQRNEEPMVDRMKQIIPTPGDRKIEYRGTFISSTGERGWYECRTIWAYKGDAPVAQWAQLLNDADFKDRFISLRRPYARDPAATERLMSLLQLYTFPDDFVDEDPSVAEGQQAIMDATAAASALAPAATS